VGEVSPDEPTSRVLHTVRVLADADPARIADRLGLPEPAVTETLLDAEAYGWVRQVDGGWSATDRGRAESDRRVAAELDAPGVREAVELVHRDFVPVDAAVEAACTAWQQRQLGDTPAEPAETLATLRAAADELAGLEARLVAVLPRFSGYHHRFTAALVVADTQQAWITGLDRDSCHRVWSELRDDLVLTLHR
jgi:hypothetical protein